MAATAAGRRLRSHQGLEVDCVDESLVKAVPHLEFLVDSGASGGPLVQRFKRLRLLSVTIWDGGLGLQELPDLACGNGQPFRHAEGIALLTT